MSPLTYLLVFEAKVSSLNEIIENQSALISYSFVLGLQSIMLLLLITQCKFIRISKDHITLYNPLLPLLFRRYNWENFDSYTTVMEHSRGGEHEAIWLIKNDRIKVRFSSFYYSNYQKLKREVPLKRKGKYSASPLRQFGSIVFGLKIK
ncbi:hypothetical protein SAMN04488028_1191 [Reichenbachiella agariperforans]|uniref:Uncharacterized protein n=2 Tax=Reichenbachiella agariperforans TaxID=156994 RepID=A0A1M6WYY7_REIAG|nr:hypothetical protein SAMN04488028_1191 [Reichenbachiella agariperforans]